MSNNSDIALDGQAVTQFDVYQFPAAYHELDSEQRDHIHEYPHRDAGAPEKLGRRLYTCALRGQFHANFPQFPDLYPYIIDQLQLLFEQGATKQFTHPSVGQFPAYIKKWNRRRDPKIRSGEVVDMVFMEDQTTAFLQGDIANAAHFATLGAEQSELDAQLAAIQKANIIALGHASMGLFGAIQTLSNDIQGISDTAQMYGNLINAKCMQLSNLCQQLDAQLDLQDARAYPVVEALHGVWSQAQTIQQDIQAQRVPAQPYVVPSTMPLTAIAQRLYGGDASRTDDLLALNANQIPDPLSVKAGVQILYYPVATGYQGATA